ncbi:UNVERIFIED_CONTAM: proteophosphoglycan PPG1 [Hammondia hammondi]|eukprot:XP_008886099.1 proteophosphoglycan PPG1 [Hammondia hammondi]
MPASRPSPSVPSPAPTGISSVGSASSSSPPNAQKSASGSAAAGSSALRSSSEVRPSSPAASLPLPREAHSLETAVSSTALRAKGRPGPPSPRGARRSSSTVSTKSMPSRKLSTRSLKKEAKEKGSAASRKSVASPQLAAETDAGVRGSRTDEATQPTQSVVSRVGTETLPSSSNCASLLRGPSSSSAGATSSPINSLAPSSASAPSFSPSLGRKDVDSQGIEASCVAEENAGVAEATASGQSLVLEGGERCVTDAREQKGEEDEEATRHRRLIERVAEDFLAFSTGVSKQAERPFMRPLFPQATGRCDNADNEISLDSKAIDAPDDVLASNAPSSDCSSWLRELVSPSRKDLEKSATRVAAGMLSFSPSSPPLSLSAASSAPPSSPPCAASRLASPNSARASIFAHSSSASPPPFSSSCSFSSSSFSSSSAGFEASYALCATPGGPQAGERRVLRGDESRAEPASLPLSEKKEPREEHFSRLSGTGDRAALVSSEETPARLSGVDEFGRTEQPEQKRDEREGESREERADGRWAARPGNAEHLASPDAEEKRETSSFAGHFFELTLEEKIHRRRVQHQVDRQKMFLLGESRASRAAALAGAAAALDVSSEQIEKDSFMQSVKGTNRENKSVLEKNEAACNDRQARGSEKTSSTFAGGSIAVISHVEGGVSLQFPMCRCVFIFSEELLSSWEGRVPTPNDCSTSWRFKIVKFFHCVILSSEENAHLQNQVKEAQALCLELKDRQNQLADSFYRDAHRHQTSLLELASTEAEGRELVVDRLTFESAKKDRIIETLHSQLAAKEEEIYELTHAVEDLRDWQRKMQGGHVAAVVQRQKDADARVALAQAECRSHLADKDVLLQRLRQVEEAMKIKDEEIRVAHERLQDHETEAQKVLRKMQGMQFDMDLMRLHMTDMEKAAKNKEEAMDVELKRQRERDRHKQQSELERLSETMKERAAQVEELEQTVRILRKENAHLRDGVGKVTEVLKSREKALSELQEQLAELEAHAHINDKSVQVELLRRGERELKKRLAEQTSRIDVLQQDSLILAQTRAENLDLRLKLEDCEAALRRQGAQLAILRHAHATSRISALMDIMGDGKDFDFLSSVTSNPLLSSPSRPPSSRLPFPSSHLFGSYPLPGSPSSRPSSASRSPSLPPQLKGFAGPRGSPPHVSAALSPCDGLAVRSAASPALRPVLPSAASRQRTHPSSALLPLTVSSAQTDASGARASLSASAKSPAGGRVLDNTVSSSLPLLRDTDNVAACTRRTASVAGEQGRTFAEENTRGQGDEEAGGRRKQSGASHAVEAAADTSKGCAEEKEGTQKTQREEPAAAAPRVSSTGSDCQAEEGRREAKRGASHRRDINGERDGEQRNDAALPSTGSSFHDTTETAMSNRLDPIERCVREWMKQSLPPGASLPFVRISEGLYLHEGKTVKVRLVNGILMGEL